MYVYIYIYIIFAMLAYIHTSIYWVILYTQTSRLTDTH